MIKSFRDLEIYQESFQLQLETEEYLKDFPRDEKFLLIDQVRRCCRGIPSLIAEGWGRRETVKEFQKYLREATGECFEMINHILLAQHKKYLPNDKAGELITSYEVLAKKTTNLKNNWQNFK